MVIVLGDMNARVIEPMSKKERQVIGKYALKGNMKPQDLKEETTRDNRNRLLEFCYENGLKLENTMFKKPTNKIVTFKPMEVPTHAPISQYRHWQTDYIMTKKTNIKVTDCETDTKSFLRSDHYPIVAKVGIKFRRINIKKKKT